MIVEAVGEIRASIRQVFHRFSEASAVARADNPAGNQVSAKIVRIEIVKRDSGGNFIERIVDANDG